VIAVFYQRRALGAARRALVVGQFDFPRGCATPRSVAWCTYAFPLKQK